MEVTTPRAPAPTAPPRPEWLRDGMRRSHPKIGRNALCLCLSGKKHKHCCLPAWRLADDHIRLQTFPQGRLWLEMQNLKRSRVRS